jgi:GNAT superfamily N-acetyltransferase
MSNPFRSILQMIGLSPRAQHTPVANVRNFIAALAEVAPAAGRGAYAFAKPGGGCHGFVQFIIHSDRMVEIHRLWTHEAGQGNGTLMMRKLCDLADEHGVELKLKALPIGRKPHPMTREQLKNWYESHGFAGVGWKLLRKPTARQPVGS